MKAMVLAAGLGTRLRPLTDDRPKALVTVGGRTLLEIALRRLQTVGVREVIVNTHHYADMIAEYLESHDNFGMRIEISPEEILLDTGGGLKKTAPFFLEKGASSEPFLVHNVDVLSTIPLDRMVRLQKEQRALVTLAVQDRLTSRYLLFDQHNQLCGRRAGRGVGAVASDNSPAIPGPPQFEHETGKQTGQPDPVQPLAFCGIHVISPDLFSLMEQEGAFSIIDVYVRLAAQGKRILAFRADEFYWRDLGRPESIAEAAQDIGRGLYPS